MRPSILLFTLIKMMKWSQVLLAEVRRGAKVAPSSNQLKNKKKEGSEKERWDHGQRYQEGKFWT